MKLNISEVYKIPGQRIEFDCAPDMTELELGGVKPYAGPVKFSGAVVNRAGIIVLESTIKTDMLVHCSRCDREITVALDIKADKTVVSEKSDDPDLVTVSGNELDLDDIAEEELLYAIDMTYLCKPECKGLCPKCGLDRNENDCTCEKKETDPRFAVLGQLLEKDGRPK